VEGEQREANKKCESRDQCRAFALTFTTRLLMPIPWSFFPFPHPSPSSSTSLIRIIAMTLQTGPSAADIAMLSASPSPSVGLLQRDPHAQSQPQPPFHAQPLSRTASGHQEATRQKIVDIIDQQFDLEILLRHSEEALIAQELAKAERMLEDLRHAILSGMMTEKEPLLCLASLLFCCSNPKLTLLLTIYIKCVIIERQGAPYGNSTISRTLGPPSTQQAQFSNIRTHSRRATAYYGRDARPPEALYAVRADGQFVRYLQGAGYPDMWLSTMRAVYPIVYSQLMSFVDLAVLVVNDTNSEAARDFSIICA